MKSALRTLGAAVSILLIAVCSVMIFQKVVHRARVDLTEDGIYTLSQATRRILRKLNQPVTLTLYYSRTAAMKGPEQIQYYNTYYRYVHDLLEEYERRSDGKVVLEVVDPRKFTEEEDEAIEHGLKRFPLSEDESFFFGLVARTELGKEKVIEFFEPGRQKFVEYDVSKLISGVIQREKKKIGILSSLPVMGPDMSPYMMQMMRMQGRQPPPPWQIAEQLREAYEVERVAADVRDLPDDIDFLMVVHPKDLSERTLFEIDQFVMNGGKLLVFVDPHCMHDRPMGPQRNPYAAMQHDSSSNLNVLLETWGVRMRTKDAAESPPGSPPARIIAADRSLAVKVPLDRNRVAALSTFLNLDRSCVNTEEVITAQLDAVRMFCAGVLEKVKDPETQTSVVPLLTTTEQGGVWTPENPFELHNPDPEAIRRNLRPAGEELLLACRVSGKLATNFPDGITIEKETEDEENETDEKTEAEEKEEEEEGKESEKEDKELEPKTVTLEPVKEAKEGAVVLVFADADMISDNVAYRDMFFGMQPVGDNVPLLLNAIDFLAGSGDLIAMRSRGKFERPFEVVEEIEAEAEQATADKRAAVEKRIETYEKQLQELGSRANKENVNLLRRTALAERRKLQDEMRKARKELRALNAGKRERIESLKFWVQFHNLFWAPAAVLLIAIALGVVRLVRAQIYAHGERSE
jgi:ABC-type uncharacterized transport system involved in gliding motility auxiliary subunit